MKHIKNTIADLKDLFERRITADAIAEEFVSFDSTMPVADAHAELHRLGFDIVGVAVDGRCTGYAMRHELGDGLLGDYRRPLSTLPFLPPETSLRTTVEMVYAAEHVIVSTPGDGLSIVTRGDLNKAPVRMWLFSLVTLLEMQMLRAVRCLPDPDAFCREHLSPGRLAKVVEVQQVRQLRRSDADLLDCLQFADKRLLLERIMRASSLAASIGLDLDHHAWQKMKRLENLRNEVAHGNDLLLLELSLPECAWHAEQIIEKLENVHTPPQS